jgi:hypothetical protein
MIALGVASPAAIDMSDSFPSPTVAPLAPGCKLNLAESEAMARQMRGAGWRVLDRPATADALMTLSAAGLRNRITPVSLVFLDEHGIWGEALL